MVDSTQNSQTSLIKLAAIFIAIGITFTAGWFANQYQNTPLTELLSPLVEKNQASKPLQKYSIPNLIDRNYQASNLIIEKELTRFPEYTSYVFSYPTAGGRITGQINLPTGSVSATDPLPAIVMLRGFVPPEAYETGVGTRNAAAEFAKAGYVTVAPDFLGYGGSDSEPADPWEARFIKPINITELILGLQTNPITFAAEALPKTGIDSLSAPKITLNSDQIGIWAHSNGGQIALTTLEILGQPLPTTLWAPVTVPFPYSILYFGDENEDEGLAMRKWLSIFERDYDVFEFSHTQFLDRLRGPLQIQHGDNDDAALQFWSTEFIEKLETENLRREVAATNSAILDDPNLEPIEVTFFKYPGANHNLQPGWDTAVKRDLEFFRKEL